MKYLQKTKEFDNILFRHFNAVYNRNTIDRWTKDASSLSLVHLGIAKNSILAKIYNAQLHKTEN